MRFFLRNILLACVLLPLAAKSQFYYGMTQEFGKSRVQYQPFYWTYYNYDKYQVFFYEGCKEIAKYVAYRTDYHIKDLQRKLDYQLDNKLQVLVYSNMGDFRQTNLGLATDAITNTGGTINLLDTKLSVYFNGSLAELDKQIRAGIADAMVDEILYGGRASSRVKSSFINIPAWYRTGLIAYLSEGWNTDVDNMVSDGITFDRYQKLNRLNEKEAAVVGHGLWQHIAESYGESSISNILYMTKVSRNIDNAFLFVVGSSTEGLLYEWIDARQRNASKRDSTQTFPEQDPVLMKPKWYREYYQAKISPNGNELLYVRNEMTQYRVYLRDLTTNKEKRIVKWGPKIDRLNDLTYPLIAWHPSGQAFAIIHEKKGIIYLSMYNLQDKNSVNKPITGIEKIRSFSYSPDGKKIVMSATKKGKGQSDIFVYQINAGGLEQITNDVWDDDQPCFINKGKMIAFASNRMQDTIKSSEDGRFDFPQSKFKNIFLFDYKTKSKILYRVSDTKNIQESEPSDFYNGYFTYLSDQNGIKNRFVAKLDSTISFVDTTEHYRYTFHAHPISNYKTNILEQDVSLKANKMVETFYVNGLQYLYVSPIHKEDVTKNAELKNTYFRKAQNYAAKIKASAPQEPKPQAAPKQEPEPYLPQQPIGSNNVDINNYSFHNNNNTQNKSSAKPKTNSVAPLPSNSSIAASASQKINDGFFPQQKNYYVNFSIDQTNTTLIDNQFLGQSYQKFTGYYVNPGLGSLLKIATSDLFEDYRIVGAMRFAYSLTGVNPEFFISIENRKKLWDKQLILHRLSLPSISENGYTLRLHTHDVQYKMRYPINEVSSIRGTISYRNDRFVTTSIDDQSLKTANTYDNWAGAKLEYVFDNTRPKGLNLYNGWRLKVFSEYYEGFLFTGDKTLHSMVNAGFDIRHYLKVHRNIIWANRLAGASSWGTDRICYYLGGVDNQIAPKFNTNEQIKHPDTYGFQTLATNMRGFTQNARNGNNFAVFNSELRVPLFSYLANHPLRSDILNNFQIIPFVDVGMCWYGTNPTSVENTTNQYTTMQYPFTVIITEPKQAVLVGYGFGLRTRLLGYFVRLDFSWGVNRYSTQTPKAIYFSLSTDF
ncbi:MAG: PD40 domain-containing protein [Bacteroidetes bacterium]|nr:PD40 domain-containing protein [Bacteroidota bacterium]